MAGSRAAHADASIEMLINTVRHQELRILGPSIAAFGKADLFFTKRLAMGIGAVLFVRRTVAHMTVKNHEGWPALRLPESLEGVFDATGVICVANPQNVPSVIQEAGRYILREGNPSVAFDCDVIVVV